MALCLPCLHPSLCLWSAGPAPTSTAPVVSEPFGRCTTSSAMSSLNAGTKLDPEEAGAEDARKLLLSKFSTVGLGNTL